jgi:hypothetical protein
MDLSLIYPVRQRLNQPQVADLPAAVRRELQTSRLKSRVPAGGSVAVAVGSRGIANIATLAKATVDSLREMGLKPFIVAAMGSHGGATAEGQRQLLADYGVTEQALGVPVRTDMVVLQIGANSWGEPVYWDKNAYEADAVVTISRIKPHTDFRGRFESGIVKMLVIGLGKREGAATHHQYGVRGLRDLIPESAKVILAKTKFALGLAVVENANEETAIIRAVEPQELFDIEPRLLEQARTLVGRIPFDELDLVVVGELGKNYSGTGMDVNVLGRQMVEGEPDLLKPKITRLCVLDLSQESHGNAVGLGIADLTTHRLLSKMDQAVMNMNYFTACFLLRAKTPVALVTDRACIEMGLKTCWQPRIEKVRMALVANTLELSHFWVTRPLVEQARGRPDLEVIGEARAVPFDEKGELRQEELFPHSVRGRRARGRN